MKTSGPFFSHDHLSEEGIALYVDALKLTRTAELPENVIDHAEVCESCKAKIIELDATLPQKMYDVTTHHPYFDRAVHEPAMYKLYSSYRVAAAITGAALLGAGYYYIISQNNNKISDKSELQTQSQDHSNEYADRQRDSFVAANFTESPNLEDLVHNNFRSTSITVLSPIVGKVTRQPITFQWKNHHDPVTLKVLNNKEILITSASVNGTQWTLEKNLQPGLYYWKLESDEDLLYVGKFIVH